jgi:hypothetical protein
MKLQKFESLIKCLSVTGDYKFYSLQEAIYQLLTELYGSEGAHKITEHLILSTKPEKEVQSLWLDLESFHNRTNKTNTEDRIF